MSAIWSIRGVSPNSQAVNNQIRILDDSEVRASDGCSVFEEENRRSLNCVKCVAVKRIEMAGCL
jgi:hypothetical protein